MARTVTRPGWPFARKAEASPVARRQSALATERGARAITYVRLLKGKVYLLTIYDKADQASLTQKELLALLEGLSA